MFILLMKDAVQVSAMGRSPEMYIEPVYQPSFSENDMFRTHQPSSMGFLSKAPFAYESSERQSRRSSFQLSSLQWRRSMRTPSNLSDLNICGSAKTWVMFFGLLILMWNMMAIVAFRKVDMSVYVAPPKKGLVQPSESSEQVLLIRELEAAVRQSGARLPRGLQVKESGSKPPSPCKTPPQEEMLQCSGSYLQVTPDLLWVNGMVATRSV